MTWMHGSWVWSRASSSAPATTTTPTPARTAVTGRRLPRASRLQQRLKSVADRVNELWTEWIAALRDSVRAPEIHQQLEVLQAEERARVEDLAGRQARGGEISQQLVSTVKQLLNKFSIVHVAPRELVDAVFPAGRATTVADAAQAFETWLNGLTKKSGETRRASASWPMEMTSEPASLRQ